MQGILPLGLRFLPSEEDLLQYLKENYLDPTVTDGTIVYFDVYSCEPWHLPGDLFLYSDRQKDMYFFTKRSSTKDGGRRASRRAGKGKWHNHSKVKHFLDANGNKIGEKRTFNYVKDSDQGAVCVKTEWIMHEYLLHTNHEFEDRVLCHIYEKAGEKIKKEVAKRSRSEEEKEEATDTTLLCSNHHVEQHAQVAAAAARPVAESSTSSSSNEEEMMMMMMNVDDIWRILDEPPAVVVPAPSVPECRHANEEDNSTAAALEDWSDADMEILLTEIAD